MRKTKLTLWLLAIALVISGLVAIVVSATEPESDSPYEYVVVLGVDGMGNFNYNTDTPNLDAIFAGGATTSCALVENPSASAQGWGSLLIGVPCDVHGLTNNSIQEGAYANDALPTIFKLLSDQKPGVKMASFCSWNSINNGIVEENVAGLIKEKVADASMERESRAILPRTALPSSSSVSSIPLTL